MFNKDDDEKKALKLFTDGLLTTLTYWIKSWFVSELTDKFMDNYYYEMKNIYKEVK